MAGKKTMSPSDASRIQSTQAKGGNPTGKHTFASRAQSAGATNNNKAATGGGGTGGAASGAPAKAPAGGKASKK